MYHLLLHLKKTTLCLCDSKNCVILFFVSLIFSAIFGTLIFAPLSNWPKWSFRRL